MSDLFQYRNGKLHCEDVPVERIAAQVTTPVYVYSETTLHDHYTRLRDAFRELEPLICYSVKGCSNVNILRRFAQWGSGFDVVSGGELHRVLAAGGDPQGVVYAGVGKTDAEIRQAIDAGIGWFNIESEAEAENIARIATEMDRTVRAALRVNPDVDPKTHRYTTTGTRESKFGVDLERALNFFETFGHHPHLHLHGIHLHIGSPVNSADPYVQAVQKTLAFIADLRDRGYTVDTLDLGGGFGADYETGQAPPAVTYAQAIIPLLRGQGLKLILEPGRSISGNAGILLAQVLYVKAGGDKQFAVIDAAMNDLIRPALYEAFHFIWPAAVPDQFVPETRRTEMPGSELIKYDIVGPVCETGDCFANERQLPPVRRGDLLAVFTAGAYGFAMASNYNSRPRAAEVLVRDGDFHVIRRRETYDDLLAAEQL